MKNIVLNIPHSSNYGIFDENFGKWSKSPSFINDVVRQWTDWYTDYLFNADNPEIKKVVFPYSRFVCDAERLENDEMEKIGQGIVYTTFNGYKRTISEEQKQNAIQLWKNHQKNLIELINEDTILIDCHSFPSEKENVDICIGFNMDWSYNEEVIQLIRNEFKENGYSVKFNKPYSNSITPETGFKYSSVMIEVNKRVYMDEKTLKLNTNPRQWMRWFKTINGIYSKLMKI